MQPFSSRVTETETEEFNPPQIFDNSVFLYMSKSLFATQLMAIRSLEIPAILFTSLFYPNFPALAGGFALVYFLALNGLFYEPSRRLVLRMDLLPDSEKLFIQKIGFGGNVYGLPIELDDLQKIDLLDFETKGKENMCGFKWDRIVSLDQSKRI